MILTGPEIIKAHKNGELFIEPFLHEHVNPNSYNFRVGNKLRVYTSDVLDPKVSSEYKEIDIPESGYTLEPNKLYLAHTIETMGSNNYAPTFAARSSVARLGLFINLSANLGDIGFVGQWTLQLCATHPLVIYPGMPIGQIMWWKPKGKIDLYNGKYQSSLGPRSSEIYLDFNKTRKHTLLPTLGSVVEDKSVGNKFNFLSKLSNNFCIPQAFCVSTEFLNDFMFSEEVRKRISSEMIDIQSTVGAFMFESAQKISDLVDEVHINETGAEMIRSRFYEIFGGNPEGNYAIRSSGTNEDGEMSSYAGIHDTFLNVSGIKNIIESIEKVAKSYYSPAAILYRINSGDFSSTPEIAVIIQQMIASQQAGVAFGETVNDELLVSIESVDGLGEKLVSGTVESTKELVSNENYLEKDTNTQEIYKLVTSIQKFLGFDIDVEWAISNEMVYLLQCRPITSNTIAKIEHEEKFEFFDLYQEDPPKNYNFNDLSEIYISYTRKRKKAMQIANKCKFNTPSGVVLNFNKVGLLEFGDNSATVLKKIFNNKETISSKLVLDFNQYSRQIIIEASDLLSVLLKYLPIDNDFLSNTVIIRPFINGEAGLIISSNSTGVIIDVAEEGLLNLNRGIIGSSKVTFDKNMEIVDVSSDCPQFILDAIKENILALIDCVKEIQEKIGTSTTEWVYENKSFYFIDYSNKGAVVPENIVNTSVISPGTVTGKVLDLSHYADELQRLSIGAAVSIDNEKTIDISYHKIIKDIVEEINLYEGKPIIFSKFPYACLSIIIDLCSGFVFEKGSSLCHLAILLREKNIPAVIAEKMSLKEITIIEGKIYEN